MSQFNTFYFSPTDSTKEVIELITENITLESVDHDITDFVKDPVNYWLGSEDFALAGVPVYGGRVPPLAAERICHIHGNRTPAAIVVTFGNRHYDDALLELKNIMEANGFLVIAAAAVVTEHNVVPRFGSGRPDDGDIQFIHEFSVKLKRKLAGWRAEEHKDLYVKGNPEYREYKPFLLKPHVTSSCNQCGVCAMRCPAGAIPYDKPQTLDRKRCISCMRCVRICPHNARDLSYTEVIAAEKALEKKCGGYKLPEDYF